MEALFKRKYPLIMFIHDGSFVQKTDIKSTLTDTVGGPIWATDREQKKIKIKYIAQDNQWEQ